MATTHQEKKKKGETHEIKLIWQDVINKFKKVKSSARAPAFHLGCEFHERSSRSHMLADGREGSVTMEAEGNAGKHVEKNTGKERNNEAHAD